MLMLVLPSAAWAQADSDILSKDDAAQVFALSKRQWRENATNVVRAGLGSRAGDALTLTTPHGRVTTLPVYAKDDARPSRLEVTVEMEAEHFKLFTDDLARDLLRDVRAQMAPEYGADGRVERTARGMIFFFTVTEAGRR